MKRSNFLASLVAVVCAVLVLGCGPSANNGTNTNVPMVSSPTPDPCAATSDQMIIDAIYAEIKVQGMSDQFGHINVISKQRYVSFNGWADSQTIKDKIIVIARGVPCVASVDEATLGNQLPKDQNGQERPWPGGGCAPGYKPCRDFCIPDAEVCSVIAADRPANTNSNSVVAPKTNSNTAGKK